MTATDNKDRLTITLKQIKKSIKFSYSFSKKKKKIAPRSHSDSLWLGA